MKTKRKSHRLVTSQAEVIRLCGHMLHNILETSVFVILLLAFVIPFNATLKIQNISLLSNDKATYSMKVTANVYFTIKNVGKGFVRKLNII
jgi:hypothetical protein